jgi:hypothetical protein
VTTPPLETPQTYQALLQAGRVAANAGDTMAARRYFRQATELAPEIAETWIGLSSVVPVLSEKRNYLERAVSLDPGNQEAQASLQYVTQLIAQGATLIPSANQARRTAETASASASAASPSEPSTATSEIAYCYRHPTRETGLRCVSCERPICASCAYPAPVGHLCPECRNQRRPVNYQVNPGQLAVAATVAFFSSMVLLVLFELLTSAVGFFSFYLAFILGPLAGALIARIVDRFVRSKRGRAIQITVGVAVVLGMFLTMMLAPLVILLAVFGNSSEVMEAIGAGQLWLGLLGSVFTNFSGLIFTIAATIATMFRLR